MLSIKYSQDKTKLQEVIHSNEGFKSLDRQAAEVINVTTNSKLKYPDGKERVDVCAAIEEMKMDSSIEGEIKGAVKACQKFNMSLQDIIDYIANNCKFSLQESKEKVMKYWKE